MQRGIWQITLGKISDRGDSGRLGVAHIYNKWEWCLAMATELDIQCEVLI
jgi:hypothetical protein